MRFSVAEAMKDVKQQQKRGLDGVLGSVPVTGETILHLLEVLVL